MRQFEPFCLMLRTPPPDFSGLQGHQNTRTVRKNEQRPRGRAPLNSWSGITRHFLVFAKAGFGCPSHGLSDTEN
jgi:hypothetical protein